jgi:hypothetical protein
MTKTKKNKNVRKVVTKTVVSQQKHKNRNLKLGFSSLASLIMRTPSGGGDLLEAYVKVLADPFSNQPVRLGWGCLVPTQTITMSSRNVYSNSSTPSNSNYSGILLPSTFAGIYFADTTIAVGSNLTGFDNANFLFDQSVAGISAEARVVALGIRITCVAPSSTVGGVVVAGNAAAATWNVLKLNTQQDLFVNPQGQVFTPTAGPITITGRPVDPDSFTFQAPVVDGFGWANAATEEVTIPFTVPYYSWQGMSGAAMIVLECVMHIEALSAFVHGGNPIGNSKGNYGGRSLSDYFPSGESVFKIISKVLPSNVTQAANLAGGIMNAAGVPHFASKLNPQSLFPSAA